MAMSGNNIDSNGGLWDGVIKNFGFDYDPSATRTPPTSRQGNPSAQYDHRDDAQFYSKYYLASDSDQKGTEPWCGPPSAFTLMPGGLDVRSRSKSLGYRLPTTTYTDAKSTSDTFSGYGTFDFLSAIDYEAATATQDDDAKSDCSTCPGSCSSNCGETGQGSICCDAEECDQEDICTEACESQDSCVDHCPGVEPCIGQDCEGPRTPCTDEACLGQTPSQPPRRAEAAAAAQTLTSFGAQGDIGNFNEDLSFLDQFTFTGDHGFLGGNGGGMAFTGNTTQFNGFGINMSNAPEQETYFQAQPAAGPVSDFGAEFLAHMRDYHDPNHEGHAHTRHMRPCMADHPVFVGHSCPFPTLDTSQANLAYSQMSDCTYTIPNIPSFADHLMTQHGSLFPHAGGWSDCVAGSNFNDPLGGITGSNPTFNPMESQGGNYFQSSSYFPTSDTGHYTQAYQHPTPASAGTVPSLGDTRLPTPDSAMTSPGVETFQKPVPPPKLKIEPLPPPAIKAKTENKQQGRSIGLDDAFRCYWQDHKTGQACLQNFADSDELDAHCKSAHTKDLPKSAVGFQCLWQGCKRENDSFSTRAKLSRHLQTHTGCKRDSVPTFAVL